MKDREIHKFVYKYIGVNSGYLGDFSYSSHRDFYADLDLDLDPNKLSETTRECFMQILSSASPDVQVKILQGILDRYSVDSVPTRTGALHAEILEWIRRLNTGAVVTLSPLRVTSVIVERALLDAEMLMAKTGPRAVSTERTRHSMATSSKSARMKILRLVLIQT